MSAQLFLFEAHRHDLPGVKIYLRQPCSKCGSSIGIIGRGSGPHAAEVRCQHCTAHQRWLSKCEHSIVDRIASFPHAPPVILLPPRGLR
jgi:hypothetical protein